MRPTPPLAPTSPVAAPIGVAGSARSNAAGSLGTVAPTADGPHSPYPTPTLEPPVTCQFGNATLSVPPRDPAPAGLTPGLVPTLFRGTPGLTTVASGEPLPGVFVELRLPTTTFVAGVVMQFEIQVRNATRAELSVSEWLSVVADDARDQESPPAQTDARWFPNFVHGPPGYGGYSIPAGQTWAIPARVVQVPFDAMSPAHLHAAVALATGQASQPAAEPGVSVFADVPLRLTAPTAAQELQLQVHADHRQLCLRATDAHGGVPVGPLFVRMTARSGSSYTDGGIGGGTGGTWAQRWSATTFPNSEPITLVLWVGGPNYVTTRAQATVPPGP